ncbi:MAG: 2-amino-4-hydroxy-6-hydroxymethyldihydropteridine diphosphokinase [Acidimicrobiia bacterium]|nr:2-amino-4-hydroxy-6-hydroxymethyldihydropteridine diphosphokinase [Acidimicrobiia bacterium]
MSASIEPETADPLGETSSVTPIRAFLGLGSNVGDRLDHLRRAVGGLDDATTAVVAVSSVYETEPVGGVEQDAFHNIVVEVRTELSADALLRRCWELEQRARRVRLVRWGPRTLDVDVLLYGDHQIDTPDLTVPHPRMTERNFVMVPLLELDPSLQDHPLLAAYDPDLAIGEVRAIGALPAADGPAG